AATAAAPVAETVVAAVAVAAVTAVAVAAETVVAAAGTVAVPAAATSGASAGATRRLAQLFMILPPGEPGGQCFISQRERWITRAPRRKTHPLSRGSPS